MRDDYDFLGAIRGKFYRPGAELIPPVDLKPRTRDVSLADREDTPPKTGIGQTRPIKPRRR